MRMNIIQHKNGQFVAETTFGSVVRTTEHGDFVYTHPDGRRVRHLIEVGTKGHGADWISVDEIGVHLGDTRGVVKSWPWQAPVV